MSKRGSWQVFGLMALTLCLLLGWLYYLPALPGNRQGHKMLKRSIRVAAAADQRHTAV